MGQAADPVRRSHLAPLPRRDAGSRAHLEQLGARARPFVLARDRSIELTGGLGALVPGATLARDSVVRVTGGGSTAVAFELVAAVTGLGEWTGAVDLDGTLGALAAAEAGVALERFAVVRRVPPTRWATVLAALIDGMSLVLTDVPRGVRLGDSRRLTARARERECALVVHERGVGVWPVPATFTVSCSGNAWAGADDTGYLTGRVLQVQVEGRGAAARPISGGSPAPSEEPARRSGTEPVRRSGTEPVRVCALWCPDWPVVAVRVRDAALVDAPIAVMERGERGPVVMAASLEARRAGVTRGLRRREAEARCAELVVIDADDPADARAFEVVVRAVEQLVPLIVLDRPGRLSFPTRGPSRYHGGDDALAHRVADAVRGAGVVDVRVGIGDGDLAAHLAARAGSVPERRTGALVVPPGGSPAFLAPWSIGVVAPHVAGGHELADLLVRLGLGTLGAFAAPEAVVLARFGVPGVHAHRLARGDGVHGASPLPVPPELVETVELDPPAVRVDEAAFAAKAVADRMLSRLDDLGLSCSRVVVEAETEHGERLTRCWRHDGALTPATLVARVRWQLEGWLSGRGMSSVTPDDVDDVVTSGITLLRIVPDDVVPAVGRQLGFWGGDPAAGDRAGRALAHVQGMLGVDAVATAVPAGGRTPAERVHWVPWGEPRAEGVDAATRDPDAPWPGGVPGPAPARVLHPPVPAELLDADGAPVTVSSRGDVSAAPAALWCDALPARGGALVACAGPWAHDLRWWDARRSRRVLWQAVVGNDVDQVACLVAVSRGRAAVEAIYD